MTIFNQKSGAEFEKTAYMLLCKYFNKLFIPQKAISIGQPAKPHKFDLVSEDNSVVCECKCYSWTKSNNIPSAKISVLNEAVLLLSQLGSNAEKYLVLKKSVRSSTCESIANYYLRLYGHLLMDIKIIEIDLDNMTLKILN